MLEHASSPASRYMGNSRAESFSAADIFLALLVLFFTLAFFHAHGASDVDRFWLDWIKTLSMHENFRDGYDGVWADYPPVSILMLDIIRKLAASTGLEVFVLLKLSVLMFLLLSTGTYYYVSGKKSVALLMHLMLMPSSILLVYLDIWYTPFLVLCFWCLYREKIAPALFWFATCCAIKYQPAILAPFIAVYIWKLYQQRSGRPGLAAAKVVGVTLLLYLAVMFWMVGGALVASWENALFHSRLSFQGLNAYWAYMQIQVMNGVEIQGVRNASHLVLMGSRLLFLLLYAVLLFRFMRSEKSFVRFLLYAMTGYYTYFVVISGVHENHLFVAAIVASLLFICHESSRVVALFVMLMSNINLWLFDGLTGESPGSLLLGGVDMTIPVALVNTGFFIYLFGVLVFFPSSAILSSTPRWPGVNK